MPNKPDRPQPIYLRGVMVVPGVMDACRGNQHQDDNVGNLYVMPRNSKITVVIEPGAFADVSHTDIAEGAIAIEEAKIYLSTAENCIDIDSIMPELETISAAATRLATKSGTNADRRIDMRWNGLHIRITRIR